MIAKHRLRALPANSAALNGCHIICERCERLLLLHIEAFNVSRQLCLRLSLTRTADTGKLLDGLLGAVVPVCAGISLEYYFSYVDPQRYGAGTKLPHNLSGLLGVMAFMIHRPLTLLIAGAAAAGPTTRKE